MDEIDKIKNKIHESEGYKIGTKIDILSISSYVFKRNYTELKDALLTYSLPQVYIKLWDVRKRKNLYKFQKEIIRLFHNFLSSSGSLIEHTRIFVRETYKSTQFGEEYTNKIKKEFDNSLLAHFIKDLRNYILHKGIPLIKPNLPLEQDQAFFLISVYKLQQWDGWTKKSKEYLNSLKYDIKLHEIINEYETKVANFYKWLGKRLNELHEKDFIELKKLQDKYGQLIPKDVLRRIKG